MKKGAKKVILIVILFIVLIIFLTGSLYIEADQDFESLRNKTYEESIDEDGGTEYKQSVVVEEKVKTAKLLEDNGAKVIKSSDIVSPLEYSTTLKKSATIQRQLANTTSEEESDEETLVTAEEIAQDLKKVLSKYITGDDEEYMRRATYLIQAETATKMPYIDDAEGIGTIKFYRFDSDSDTMSEENRLKYVTRSKFEELKQAFKNSGDETVFKYFTVDKDVNIIVAYGRKETKKITTNGDVDLTETVVKEASGDELYTGDYKNGFTAGRYTINEKVIDYQALIEQYIMPRNLLYALLVQTRDIDFVEEIAGLAYNTEIAIGIYDNESISFSEEKYTYNKVLEATTNLKIDYSALNIVNPKVSKENLSGLTGEKIPSSCEAIINQSESKHNVKYENSDEESKKLENNLYIQEITDEGITKIGPKESAKLFETTYRLDINSKSSPTVGIVLADTWIAKWTAKYSKQPKTQGPFIDSGVQENAKVEEYSTKDTFINEFKGTLKSNISEQLKNHATSTREGAITAIYENAKDRIVINEMTVDNVSEELKRKWLSQQINGCKGCQDIIEAEGIEEQNIYDEVTKEDGKLRETEVGTYFYEETLPKRIAEENKKAREEAEKKFKQELEKEGAITYSQAVDATKYNVNINFSSKSERTTTTYIKDETIERANDGEKFAEIYNKKEYYHATRAIEARIQWFWEYIRKDETTEKLEHVLRYLFNIATDSNDFGNFTGEEIEGIFKIFDPKLGSMSSTGIYSIFGFNITKEEFVEKVKNYNGGASYYKLSDVAEDFYDICTSEKYNINPCIAFAWACMETGYGQNIPNNNLFGMDVINGASSGTSYASYADSIEDFCKWCINNASSSSQSYSRAQEFATVNTKFEGTPEQNIYVLFAPYMFLGHTHLSDEPDFNNPAGQKYYEKNGSTWGAGGRIYLYYMYELRRIIYRRICNKMWTF